MMRLLSCPALAFLALGLWAAPLAGQEAPLLDPSLPIYRPVTKLEGELKLSGSDTISHVAAVWADGFRRFYPGVKIDIAVIGSSRAVEAVTSREADIGLLSRRIRADEIVSFQQKFGYPPKVLTPCLERLAVYVHKDNPIPGISVEELDAIYSSTRHRGGSAVVTSWGQLGLDKSWADRPVLPFGRDSRTGSQVFFQEMVLLGGDYRAEVRGFHSNLEMVRAIAAEPGAIGFAGLSFAMPGIRAVPLATTSQGKVMPVDANPGEDRRYPLVRQLQLVVNHRPDAELPSVEREFVKYVFSRLGQEDVIKAGFEPIRSRPAVVALDSVGLGIAR